MLRLFGLLFCILLTLVFPFLAYEMNDGIMIDSIASTSVFFVIIIALFPESSLKKKAQEKCVVLVGDDQTVCDREATSVYFCEVDAGWVVVGGHTGVSGAPPFTRARLTMPFWIII